MSDNSQIVRDFLESVAGKELQLAIDMQREAIINRGKKARNEYKSINTFAELAGYDKCVAILMKMAQRPMEEVKVVEEE